MSAVGTLELLWAPDSQAQSLWGTSAFPEPFLHYVKRHLRQALELAHEDFVEGITFSPKEKERNGPEIALTSHP